MSDDELRLWLAKVKRTRKAEKLRAIAERGGIGTAKPVPR